MMRWWRMATMVAVGLAVPSGLTSQERDWDRLGDRIARAVEHALEQAGRATAQALAALEDLELEMDWDAGAWSWEDEEAGPRVQEEFRWTGVVDAGDVLEIKGVNGPISATPASGGEVEVVAVKSGRRSDPANVTIDVIQHAGGVTLCAIYPTPEGSRANECGVGEDGRNRVRRNDVRVAWEIRVPRGVDFRGRTVNGDVEAIGLGAEVDAETVNGDVVIETTGFAAARTVNGSIEARMDSDPREDVSFETVNGSIRLDLAEGIDADLDASWLNGSLETEIPFQVHGRMGRRSAEGTLGEGGATLRLRTVNGSIRIY